MCGAVVVFASVGLAGYWFFSSPHSPNRDMNPRTGETRLTRQTKIDDGAAEASEVIEPLIVDRNTAPVVPTVVPVDAGPASRIEWVNGMQQPPRPDAGKRMPFADEEEDFGSLMDLVRGVLESAFSSPSFRIEP
jgi:hypothetical protein